MASVPVYCLCGKPYDPQKFMIQCDACKEWFHGGCVGLYEHQSCDIEKYHCPKCEKMFGPSISKQRTNWHRHDYSEADAESKAVQTGTPVFITELKSRHFPSADEILLVMRGHQLTLPSLLQNGFDRPILVENLDGLGLVVPASTLSLEDVVKYLGPDIEVDAIDVTRQDDIRMTINEFVRYHNSSTRSRVINIISLEFSNTPLSPLVEPPYIVNKLSWTQNVWPEHLPDGCIYSKPNVNKYCLIGVRDSYTDFHIDFGGTSVWYHVLRGEKVFYLIRPTQANLALYKRWMASSNRSETFFGDQVDACYRCIVKQGQTLFIPTAWIHAVLTPVDSLVFGGNFLHSLNIQLQLQVYDIEKRIKTPEKYRFPWFETCNWYAAKHILEELIDQNASDRKPLPYLIQGTKALLSALKSWTQDKDLKSHKDEIPQTINYVKLIKDLAKELRHAEKTPQKKLKLRQLPPRDRRGRRGMSTLLVHSPNLEEGTALDSDVNASNSVDVEETFSLSEATTIKMENEVTDKQEDKMSVSVKCEQLNAEIVHSPLLQNSHIIPNNNPAETGRPVQVIVSASPTKRILSDQATPSKVLVNVDESVYDFRDSDDDSLVVDETPPSRLTPRKNGSRKIIDYGRKKGPLKLKLSINGKSPPENHVDGEVPPPSSDGQPEQTPSSPKLGGIEELLRASGYAADDLSQGTATAEEDGTKLQCAPSNVPEPVGSPAEHTEGDDPFVVSQSGRTSPSTREAIQGMLSMGRAVQFSSVLSPQSQLHGSPADSASPLTLNTGSSIVNLGSNATSPMRGMLKRKRKVKIHVPNISEEDDFLSSCHQDAEFVYPSLEVSDEDGPIFKTRGRSKNDEAWNPKARLVPNFPKPDRPVREGVRKEAVESGLAAAAAKLAHLPPPKRPYHRRKAVKTKMKQLPEKELDAKPGPSSQDPNLFDPLAPLTPKSFALFKGKRAKKGFATTKQRLGRILKIHKMLH